jgi:glycosyltransferase involved in cell wall biosynthesis
MDPLVSICCITYNHEKYIRDAIEGFLMQKTDFPVEILIFDDASQDRTQEIIEEYAKKNENIVTFLQTENQRSKGKNGYIDWLLPAAKGKYIALCEGDDYWIDPYKLQNQVDFLNENENFVMCFTNCLIKNEITKKEKIAKINIWDSLDTRGLLMHNSLEGVKYGEEINSPGHTSTIVFRNHLINSFPNWYSKCFIGDEPLFLILSKFGNAKFINTISSVYRQHLSGVSTINFTFESDYLGRIFMYKKLNTYFDKKYSKYIFHLIAQYYFKLSKLYFSQKKYFQSCLNLIYSFRYDRNFISNKVKHKTKSFKISR